MSWLYYPPTILFHKDLNDIIARHNSPPSPSSMSATNTFRHVPASPSPSLYSDSLKVALKHTQHRKHTLTLCCGKQHTLTVTHAQKERLKPSISCQKFSSQPSRLSHIVGAHLQQICFTLKNLSQYYNFGVIIFASDEIIHHPSLHEVLIMWIWRFLSYMSVCLDQVS